LQQIIDTPFRRGAFLLGNAVGLIGMAAVIGYFAGTPWLASWGTTLSPMAPSLAVSLMALGFAAMLFASLSDGTSRFFLAAAGLAAALVALESIFEILSAGGFKLNEQMIALMAPGEGYRPGPMAPLSAVSLLLLGTGSFLLASGKPKLRLVAVGLANAAGIAGSVVLLGYLYGVPLLYGDRLRPVSLPAAISFVTYGATLLALAGPRYLPISALTGRATRARLLRFFLPVVGLVLIVDGLLAHYLPREADSPLTSALSILIFTGASMFIVYVATRISGDSIDDAERKRRDAEKKVEATRAMFESLFESAPGSILVVNSRGRIVRVNAETERKFGYHREELVGQPIETLIPSRYTERHRGHTTNYFEKPRVRPMGAGIELFAKRKDGSEFPVDILLGPLESGGPQPEGDQLVLSIVYDLTDRKRTQTEIQNLNRELERRIGELEAVNRELEAFSYSVSHDLRAPLRAIYGFSQMLEEDYGKTIDAEGNRLLKVIQDNTKQMGQLIDDLLAFSRLGRQSPAYGPVDMGELAKAVSEELQNENSGRKLAFTIGALPPATGDRAMLRQVLVNLISNAVKFTRNRETAQIEIGALPDGEETAYFVRDNGVGFEMQYASKIFGVFQRLHRQQDFEGTGVGLAIVQRVVSRHGGKIWAESTPGEGATFFFTLPHSQAEEMI
jgi:PAS domain S-box-containing protein